MKKLVPILIALFVFQSFNAQHKDEKLEEYTASNGITYKVGDEIILGEGKFEKGRFISVDLISSNYMTTNRSNRLQAKYKGHTVIVKKIRRYKIFKKDSSFVALKVKLVGELGNVTLDIESAIKLCEIEDCNKPETELKNTTSLDNKIEQLKKLKELLDSGILTEEEFNAEKKKILDQN